LEHKTGIDLTVSSTLKKPSKNWLFNTKKSTLKSLQKTEKSLQKKKLSKTGFKLASTLKKPSKNWFLKAFLVLMILYIVQENLKYIQILICVILSGLIFFT